MIGTTTIAPGTCCGAMRTDGPDDTGTFWSTMTIRVAKYRGPDGRDLVKLSFYATRDATLTEDPDVEPDEELIMAPDQAAKLAEMIQGLEACNWETITT